MTIYSVVEEENSGISELLSTITNDIPSIFHLQNPGQHHQGTQGFLDIFNKAVD